MAKSGSGRPLSHPLVRGRPGPKYVPGVPGLPVQVTFRVRETRWMLFGSLGLVVGAALAFLLRGFVGWRLAGPLVALGGVCGWLASLLFARDRCVERGCGAVLPRGVTHCPRCGSAIIGVLAVGGGAADRDD